MANLDEYFDDFGAENDEGEFNYKVFNNKLEFIYKI